MKHLSELSDRKLSALIRQLENELTAAKLAMRTQKSSRLTRELLAARVERMRRAKERKTAA